MNNNDLPQMTLQDAIIRLKMLDNIVNNNYSEAIYMAVKVLEQQMIISEELLNRLNERKMSIPISETYTEDHKVGWKDGIFWSDVLEIFEEMGVEE
jgi:SOS response regulatory protein OraA/RecX